MQSADDETNEFPSTTYHPMQDSSDVDDGSSPIIADGLIQHHNAEPLETHAREHHQRRSVKSISEVMPELREFFSSVELLVCFLAVFAGELIPRLFHTHLQTWEGRQIPYQETAAGDILLELGLNNEVVDTESFSGLWLVVGCMILPAFLLSVLGLWFGPRRDGLSITCSFLLALGTTEFVTNMIKFYCAYFRPNFYHLCDMVSDADNGLVCNDEQGERQGRMSFPSGHSSTSFCSMTMVTLWLLGNVNFRRHGRHPSYARRRAKYVAASLPMLFAFFVASSRVHDDYHHPADVATGGLIGFACASWAYGMWYPSINDLCSGVPLETLEEEEAEARQHRVL